MLHLSPRLAVPIKSVVDAEGRLITADAAVRRIHFGNGGVEGGVLAVPGLLELASLCWRIGLRLERTVHVADKDHDLELWVEAEKQENAVHLSIVGWQEHASVHRSQNQPFKAKPHSDHRNALSAMHVNADGTVLHAGRLLLEAIGTHCIAEPFDQHFELIGDNRKFADLLADQALPAERFALQHLESGTLYKVLIEVLRSDGDEILGARLVFLLDEPARDPGSAPKTRPSPPHSGLGLGRHFASAVRQPLGRILANAETIGSELNGPILEQYSSYAKDIASAARHLSELVSDLEDLDAIDRPGFKVASEPVEFGDIAKRVAGLLALKAADHQIEIITPAPNIQGYAKGEFRRVLQIVLNLVGNAIRYSPGGSKVMITIDPEGPSLSVADEGPGIPEEDRERVFSKFERLGRSGDGGSGLGLYISKKLARAMGGDLNVGSAEGGGAKFTLRLPPA